MELHTYLTILRRRRGVILLTLAATIVVSIVGSLLLPPRYAASTTLRVAPAANGPADRVGWDDIQYADRLMNTYTKIVTSRPLVQALVDKLHVVEAPAIEVTIPANTELMIISVRGTDPALAAAAANTLAALLIEQVHERFTVTDRAAQESLRDQLAQVEAELEQARMQLSATMTQVPADAERIDASKRVIELKEGSYSMLLEQYERTRVTRATRANTVSIIEPAIVPPSPTFPNLPLNLGLAVLIGLTVGVGMGFVFENLDTRVYSVRQVAATIHDPPIWHIPATTSEPHVSSFRRADSGS